MAKKIKAVLKIELEAGKATPGQKIGPVLGQHGVNIGEFITKYNDMTRDRMGDTIPCILTVYEDRSFLITLKTPPVASLVLKAAGIKKGSGQPNTEKVGKIKKSQLRKIAELKLQDLNTNSLDSALSIVSGTAKSMGLEIIED
jgi:large subunit ribosomal protein L11